MIDILIDSREQSWGLISKINLYIDLEDISEIDLSIDLYLRDQSQ